MCSRPGVRMRSRSASSTDMGSDPNMRAFVYATALFTAIFFSMAAYLPVGLLLKYLLRG